MELRAMSPAALSQGGALVPDALSSQIIDLANVYGTFRQHSDVYQLGSDSLGVPRSVSDPVATFTAANGLIAESQGDWDLVQLVSKKAASLVRIPTELMEDSVINIADRVTFQLSRSFSKLEDSCGYIGNGSSTYGGINGLLNIVMDGAHNLAKVSATTGHDLFSEIDAVDLSNMVARLPEFALEGAAWYCSATAFGSVFSRIMQTAGGNSTQTLGGKIPTMYGGFPVVLSSVLPSATSSYLNLPMLLFGNMRQSSKFGSRRDIRIQMLTETFAQNDQIGIQATERFDIVNSDLGSNTVQGPMVALIGA